MRAVIIAPGHSDNMSLINEYYPTGMIPFLGKPFLQHIVEFIISLEIKKIDFILTHLPQKVESFFGNGERWGCDFTFHLAKSTDRAYEMLNVIDFADEQATLIAHEAFLPLIEQQKSQVYFTKENDKLFWCGWAWVPTDQIDTVTSLRERSEITEENDCEITQYLTINSYSNLLASIRKVLNKDFDKLLLTAKEVEPGVWLSRNVLLPSTTAIQPPVYIGENCRFAQNIKINGNVVIEEGCIIEDKSTLENAVIFPKSYVGESLDLKNVVIDKNRLINIEFGAEIEVVDDFILGNLNDNVLKNIAMSIFSRTLAMTLFIVFMPLFLFTIISLKLLRRGAVFFQNDYIVLPAKCDANLWQSQTFFSFCKKEQINHLSPTRHFFLLFIPGLWKIACGKMHFVGIPPRNKEEIENLPQDWRSLYISSKSGIITEQYVKSLASTAEDLYASEAFYAVSAGFKQDLYIGVSYLKQVLFGRTLK
ncbi:NDP-sugar synthase [Candidatus Uabimicrobium amorphum]|uniref:Nucleotidyltransferase n=1 Tax=Uabimicrobium amorphum TaxID=2596890 RepID=A0A5S9ITK1_UABAM|nr:NDP-sugar synthase [Candidatus Uabimicrobium amorphum]BBM86900.1 nucleotidyltransferase [Candidatus Uabimicrobium amorphum]